MTNGSIRRGAQDSAPVNIKVNGHDPNPGEDVDADGDDGADFRIEKDANGNDRYIYDEIDPDDNSELDELGPEENTIGNIPLSF